MPHPVVYVLIFFAVVALAPFVLLGGAAAAADHDGLPPVSSRVVQNAGIAYALRGPLLFFFFVLGARGAIGPLIAAAAAVFCGTLLLQVLRHPLRRFLNSGVAEFSPPTLPGFVATAFAGDRAHRVKTLAATLTALALGGMLVIETVGIAYGLRALVMFAAPWAAVTAAGMLVLALACVLIGGERASLQAAQAQLGLIYLGLFGATAFLLYLLLAAYPPMPPHGVPSLAALVLIAIVLIVYRRSRYVDTAPLGRPRPGSAAGEVIETRGGKLFRRFNKVLNPVLTAVLIVIIVFALIGLTAFGWDRLARDAMRSLAAPSAVSLPALAAMVVLLVLYPLADATNWHILLRQARRGMGAPETEKELRMTVRTYAGETALMALFAGVLGALAASATVAWRSATPLETFAAQITVFHNFIVDGAVALLVPAVLIAVFATMVMLCAAIFSTLREACPQQCELCHAAALSHRLQRPSAAATLAALAILAAFGLAVALIPPPAVKTVLLVAFIGFACSQLLLLPLILHAVRATAQRPLPSDSSHGKE